MSAHPDTQDQLVEQPAKAAGPPSPWSSPSGRGDDGLFAQLGWAVAGPPPNAGKPRVLIDLAAVVRAGDIEYTLSHE